MPVSDKVDYDRGVIIRVHDLSGTDVFMYVDEPGIYMTAHGGKVSDQFAAEAGFDVDLLAKERKRIDLKRKANEAIDQELNDQNNLSEEVVEERNGFKLVSIGLGRHHIKDPEGNRLTSSPLPQEAAEKVFNSLAGEKEKDEKQVPSQTKK
jgi:hypothetical protein